MANLINGVVITYELHGTTWKEISREKTELKNDYDHWKAWAKFDKRLGATARVEWNGGNFYKYTTTMNNTRIVFKRGE
jgi:hypothetical protein